MAAMFALLSCPRVYGFAAKGRSEICHLLTRMNMHFSSKGMTFVMGDVEET
jgi:hypothetical protein